MTAAHIRERVAKNLLNEITQFRSSSMLNRAEAALSDREALGGYAEMLVEKVEATRFPSPDLLNRLNAVLERLEQAEQHEHERRAA